MGHRIACVVVQAHAVAADPFEQSCGVCRDIQKVVGAVTGVFQADPHVKRLGVTCQYRDVLEKARAGRSGRRIGVDDAGTHAAGEIHARAKYGDRILATEVDVR